MNLIEQNPYRVLGVWAGATDREIARQRTKMKAYLSANKNVELETDLKFFSPLIRNEDIVNQANSSIEKTEEKIFHALFWFGNFTPIDETALNHFINKNWANAIEIWRKPLQQRNSSERLIWALNNLSTYYLFAGIKSNSDKKEKFLKKALEYKLRILSDDLYPIFINSFKDETFKNGKSSQIRIGKSFLLAFQNYIEFNNVIDFHLLTETISNSDKSIAEISFEILLEQPSSLVEKTVKHASNNIKDHPDSGNKTGQNLYKKTIQSLDNIGKLVGKDDIRYQALADKVASAILDSSIAYFNHHTKDTQIDPGDDSFQLLKISKRLACSANLKKRINENYGTIQEWVEAKPLREKRAKASNEFNYIEKKAVELASLKLTINLIKEFAVQCHARLMIIEQKLGTNDSEYIDLSNFVVNVSMNSLIKYINDQQALISSPFYTPTSNQISELHQKLKRSKELMQFLGTFKMKIDTRNALTKNQSDLNNITSSINSAIGGNSGCYIATMAYGSYEHPQVRILRKFRDQYLNHYKAGRIFILWYYTVSPKLVSVLKDKPLINITLQRAIDYIIKKITKQ